MANVGPLLDLYKHAMYEEKDVTDPMERYYYRYRMQILVGDTQDAALSPEDNAQLALKGMQRGWFRNNSGVDVTIDYNGKHWTFVNGQEYSADIQEKSFFLSKANEQGHPMASISEADWVAGAGANSVFYW